MAVQQDTAHSLNDGAASLLTRISERLVGRELNQEEDGARFNLQTSVTSCSPG